MASNYSGQRWSVTNKSTNYTLTRSDYLVRFNTTSGDLIATLPAGEEGMAFKFKKIVEANTLTIVPDGSELIDEAATLVLVSKNDAPEICFDGTTWSIV